MSIMSGFFSTLDKAVMRRARDLEEEKVLFGAADESEYFLRANKIEAKRRRSSEPL
jgi:hypothetical protein